MKSKYPHPTLPVISISRFSRLNGDDTKKIGMCGAQIGLSDRPNRV